MSGLFMATVIFVAVLAMIIAISKFKQHPFLVMILVSVFVGLVCGMPAGQVIKIIKDGFGGILASIGIVIVAGTIIGTILEKTGAALVVHEAVKEFGAGGEIASTIGEELFGKLKAPVRRIGSAFCPVPFSNPLETAFMPQAAEIGATVKAMLGR